MSPYSDLRILFPTSFSDACFQTGRAIAQLADCCRISLTIAHIVPIGSNTARARQELESFLAEASHYGDCRRVLIEAEDKAAAIQRYAHGRAFDLIAAPASDRLGLHSLFAPSLRGQLLRDCATPLWTGGSSLERKEFKRSIRTVACLMDLEQESDSFLPLVAAFAARAGAKVRVVSVLPPIDEGTLARFALSMPPLTPEVAGERIREACAGLACPEVDVVTGHEVHELPRLLKRCEADLAFAGPGQALHGTLRPRLARPLDRLPCPVICVDGASARFSSWTFQRHCLEFTPVEPRSASRTLELV